MKTLRDFVGDMNLAYTISESPQIIDKNLDFGLNNKLSNSKNATNFLSKISEVIRETDDYKLFISEKDATSGYIVMVSKEENLIVLFVEYSRHTIRGLGDFVTQIKLWRSFDFHYTRGVTDEIFFNILLKRHKSIMSDFQQTKDGKRFWVGQLASAVSKGYKVGLAYTKASNRHTIWYDSDKESFPSWMKEQEKAWGPTVSHTFIRFVISK